MTLRTTTLIKTLISTSANPNTFSKNTNYSPRGKRKCLTPGCDGWGNTDNLKSYHNVVKNCPNAKNHTNNNETTSTRDSDIINHDLDDNCLQMATNLTHDDDRLEITNQFSSRNLIDTNLVNIIVQNINQFHKHLDSCK